MAHRSAAALDNDGLRWRLSSRLQVPDASPCASGPWLSTSAAAGVGGGGEASGADLNAWVARKPSHAFAHTHALNVFRIMRIDEACECSSCVALKLSYDEGTRMWTMRHVGAAMSAMQGDSSTGSYMDAARMHGWLASAASDDESSASMPARLPPYPAGISVPGLEPVADASATLASRRAQAAGAGTRGREIWKATTTVQQVYVSTWCASCLCGMLCIIIFFMSQGIVGDVIAPPSAASSPPLSYSAAEYTASGATLVSPVGSNASEADPSRSSDQKFVAASLCFMYAACAWVLSNGIIANPRCRQLSPSALLGHNFT